MGTLPADLKRALNKGNKSDLMKNDLFSRFQTAFNEFGFDDHLDEQDILNDLELQIELIKLLDLPEYDTTSGFQHRSRTPSITELFSSMLHPLTIRKTTQPNRTVH